MDRKPYTGQQPNSGAQQIQAPHKKKGKQTAKTTRGKDLRSGK